MFPALTKTEFPPLLAGFRLDGDYVNRICHISSSNYATQWGRIGPPQRQVKYKIVRHFYLIDSQQSTVLYLFDLNLLKFGALFVIFN